MAAGLGTKSLFQKTQSEQITTQQLTAHTARTNAVHREHRTKKARGCRGPAQREAALGGGPRSGRTRLGGGAAASPSREPEDAAELAAVGAWGSNPPPSVV